MASLKDIANQTGFSIRTVSRVLKGSDKVNAKTKETILDCAKKIGYRPNIIARSLRTGKSHFITILINSVDELYTAKVAAFERVCREAGYTVDLCFGEIPAPDENGKELFEEKINTILDRSPAGFAIFSNICKDFKAFAEKIESCGIPYIFMDTKTDKFDTVMINREQGVYESVCYLIESGRKKIAYLGPYPDDTRLPGYMRALKKYGVEPIIIEYPFPLSSRDPYSYGKNLIKYFLECSQKPDAVQAYSDLIGLGFLAGLHENGIKVPEDIGLVGFDDRVSASMCWPLLTTVAQPNEGVGSTAAEILLRKIKGEPTPEGGWSTTLPTKLIIREST